MCSLQIVKYINSELKKRNNTEVSSYNGYNINSQFVFDKTSVQEAYIHVPTNVSYRRRVHPLNCPHTYLATLPCYDPGRSTVAMDAAGTHRGRSGEPKVADRRRLF